MHRLAALVPRPRLHLIRYHGVLAPNARLRERVVPQGPPARAHVATAVATPAACDQAEPVRARSQQIGWARLLKRVFDIDLRRCPSCGAGKLNVLSEMTGYARNRRFRYAPCIALFNDTGPGENSPQAGT
jgi:hypothetical protein